MGVFGEKLFQQMGFNEQNCLISGFTPSEIYHFEPENLRKGEKTFEPSTSMTLNSKS